MHTQKTLHLQGEIFYHLSLTLTIKELASDGNTFQVGDDICEEDSASIPEPHIQLTPHQIKQLQVKDPSLAVIMKKLQKSAHSHKPLPNTYFLNMDGELYHCVREGSQSFEAVVVPKKFYQLVPTTCHDLMGHSGTT